ncbi:restriction system protein [Mesobacillus persicus]|uniref:Restriction system protein n=1 Tax=Mesobacillus persicus TaxID=930146 RepID=A0A1H8J6D3_9BACI|nr:restriction endonuclease [Mesobacillus persicus]SEN76390.1 restriction system protein [Mesobacillus persicus]
MFEKNIANRFLGETKTIKAKTEYELHEKVRKQKKQWKEKENIERMKIDAHKRTISALNAIREYRSLLEQSLTASHIIEWENSYDKSSFTKEEPLKETFNIRVGVPKEDKLFEFFLPFLKKKREEKQHEAEKMYQEALTQYLYEKNQFLNEQQTKNSNIDSYRTAFENGDLNNVERYFTMVLNYAPYPSGFSKEFVLEYDETIRNLIIEYRLPHPSEVPNQIEFKFIQSRKEIDEKKMKNIDFQEFYDTILYQICLRSIYECFISDYPHHLETIVFNGWVHGIDTATGQEFDSCILSIHADKEEFIKLNLSQVIPKDCFKKLKGLSAGALHHFAPVRPILELNRHDKRFIEGREILADINSTPNLAQMDWEDFEHLIRELFELYFKDIGGEVNVTQRSREGGVDAVILDPDPIRGGKYIIQAKRYNDVVPPSAVRELNGIMNDEGAARGILVTTAYFGKESRDFVKNKPISLIDGPQLVYMLNEHGYKVKCEINKGKKETS